MSTHHLTIYDLLRITYTYEVRAMEAEAKGRSLSVCSVSLFFPFDPLTIHTRT